MGPLKPGMRAYLTSLSYSALVAILSPAVDLVVGTGQSSAVPETHSTCRVLPRVQTTTAGARSDTMDDANIALWPEPLFDDLTRPRYTDRTEEREDVPVDVPPNRNLTYYVEVYENEERDNLYRRWREPTAGSQHGRRFGIPGWSYKDGSAALPPAEILPPDDWGWVSEWKIDGSGRRDAGGWEYSKEVGKFDSSRVPRGKKLTDRFRRRRWIRAMQPRREQGTEDGGLESAALLEAKRMGAPALHLHAYEYDPEDFGLELGKDVDLDLLPEPDVYLRNSRNDKSSSLPAFGHAVTAIKGWWTEEFTFRGFGIGVVKPVFRGVLLRPDVGVGIRLPLTLHFRSWERQEALPSVSASFFVLWPPAVQVSQALSYPAELLQEWATTAVRKILVPSKEALQARQRKETVQRLGISIGVRYSATYGFQWWLAPYFFLLPGVRVVWHLYESIMVLLSSMALVQRFESTLRDNTADKDTREEVMWLVALRYWAAAKTSGLGYSLNYAGSRLGGAVIINFQPFFLPTFAGRRSRIPNDNSPAGEPVIDHGQMDVTVIDAAESRAHDVNISVPLGLRDAQASPSTNAPPDGGDMREAIAA